MNNRLIFFTGVFLGVLGFSHGETAQPSGEIAARAKEIHSAMRKTYTDFRIEEVPQLSEKEKGGIQTQLTVRGIVFVLKQMGAVQMDEASIMKILPESVLNIGNLYQSNDFIIKRVSGGNFSDQIYIVTLKNKEKKYVLKIMKPLIGKVKSRQDETPERELQNLKRIKVFIESKGEKDPDFPDISTAEDVFFYMETAGFKRHIAVLPIAEGEEMKDLFASVFKNSKSSNSSEELSPEEVFLEAAYNLGKQIAKFHYWLASPEVRNQVKKGIHSLDDFKTVTHRDLHFGNIFYNKKTKKIALIDVNGMINTIVQPRSVKQDLARLYSMTNLQDTVGMPLTPDNKKILNNIFEKFAQGYGDAFLTLKTSNDQSSRGVGRAKAMKELVMGYFKELSSDSKECLDYYQEHKKQCNLKKEIKDKMVESNTLLDNPEQIHLLRAHIAGNIKAKSPMNTHRYSFILDPKVTSKESDSTNDPAESDDESIVSYQLTQ
jgi:hypothetical protein